MTDIWKNRNWCPMLLKEIDRPFDSKDYIFEVKFDGIRAIIFADKKGIKVQSRNKQDLTRLFPELKDISTLVNKNVIFDGEIVAFEDGKYSFSKIQKRLHLKENDKIERASIENPVTFVVFDILYENRDLTDLALIERKKILGNYKDTDYFVKTKAIEESGIELFKSVKKMELEGIVAKCKSGTYHINKRTDDFIKIKNIQRDEFLVGGYEEKKNGLISLAIGEYVGGKFVFISKSSIGPRHTLYEKVKNAKKSKNKFYNFAENINFIEPKISCHVEYLERTKGGHLRHPVIKDI